jgi:hypothetical protein
VTEPPVHTPIRERALALHSRVARFHRVFATGEAELVLAGNAGIVLLGAGLVWFQFETPWRTLLAGMVAAYVALFVMLMRAETAIAVGIVGGLIGASWLGLLATSFVVRWNVIAACGFGACVAALAFLVFLRTYRSFSEALRKLGST